MLGYEFRWAEIPNIIKIGILLWVGAIVCFVFMVAVAILPSVNVPSDKLLRIAYLASGLFTAGVIMVIIGLPQTTNHHPAVKNHEKNG